MSKVVLITGASRGIGAATAIYLAEKGYNICINYKSNSSAASQVLAKIRRYGVKVIAVKADASIESDVLRLFNEIDNELGVLTHLVNNVGVLFPQSRVEELTALRINTIFTTNVTSYFLCCREAIKRMSTNHGGKGGSIVNVSSAASRLGSPHEYIDYAASKGAIDTLTTGLSLEVASENIRVNCVRPGFIHTDMHSDGGEPERINRVKENIPLQRGGQPFEVASAISYLLDGEASYITGSFIDIAGGK
jgi:NAD(P)-dependent dehydrogenase (short-subunit alcohol dehydrogenase family)